MGELTHGCMLLPGVVGKTHPTVRPLWRPSVDRLPTTMMPPMQKMAATLALASALCHLATMAVMMNMHIELRHHSTLPARPINQ